jgi:hypothetical protein
VQVSLFDQPGMTDLSAHVHFPSLAVPTRAACALYCVAQCRRGCMRQAAFRNEPVPESAKPAAPTVHGPVTQAR